MRWLFILIAVVGLISTGLVAQTLPTQTSTLFSGSGNCATCHQPGPPNTGALLDLQGRDVSPVTLWRSTMMASASKDPFWQAKVSAEISANPHLQSVIEDKCTTCHAPMGRTEAIYNGASGYTFAEMKLDSLALDGVSCTLCHQIKSDNLGLSESFSGHYLIENDRIIYGPFQNPLTSPMQNSVNYTPTHGLQTLNSELCATCHTLFTPYVDNDGNVVGEAPEQTPYLEWKNSVFPSRDVQCQTCHMPKLNESIIIANHPTTLVARSEYALHFFVGGNVYMLKLLKAHSTALGLTANTAQLDSTLSRTIRFLQNETAELSAEYQWITSDTLLVKVAVQNKTGHKFPTAYPSRRAWLELRLNDAQGQVLFESGAWDAALGEIRYLSEPFEPHYTLITKPEQVQIYQSVMKDVDNNVNYTLLRAAGYLKDNRIPPQGFSVNGPAYDSTAIIGSAVNDVDFNRDGSGTDTVIYKIGGLNKNNQYTLTVKLNYQSLSPRFVADLLQYDTPEVQAFTAYYQQVPNLPLVIDSLQQTVTATGIKKSQLHFPQRELLVSAYPNPFNPQTTINVQTSANGRLTITIFNIKGEKIKSLAQTTVSRGVHRFVWEGQSDHNTPLPSGTYLLRIELTPDGGSGTQIQTKKIILLK
ncbi:FlgD immunoglobulin-like domain containing protein [Caldithrix abyssi]